jgi:hypothetical protein
MRWPAAVGPWHFVPGGVLVVFGILVLWVGRDYQLGTMARIGPGFFPHLIAWLLIFSGIAVVLESVLVDEAKPRFRLRPLLMIMAGILVWSLVIERFGLYPATFLLVLVSAMGESDFRVLPSLALALGLSVLSHLVFIAGFGLPFVPVRW